MQRWSESRQRVVAHPSRRGGREARLARGGFREHDAFLGHEMRGPAGTGRGGVSMALMACLDLDLAFGAVDVNIDLACTSLISPHSPLPPPIASPPPSAAAGEPI